MRKLITFITFILVVAFMISCGKEATRKTELKEFKEKYSYALGIDMGESIKNRIPLPVDVDILIQAILDTLQDDRSVIMDKNEIHQVMREFQNECREVYAEKQKEKASEKNATAKKNQEEGEKFLEENKTKEGVITTASGLQYKVLTQGTGPKPTTSDKVEVHYRGTLLDGTEFDSSYKRGETIEFAVTGVIAGWTEALQLMNVGSKYQLFIPSELAYGARGAGGDIGPNATLIFEVELISIK